MNKQNSANGLALTSAYLFIMICQLMIPHYFRNGPVYLICTLIWLLGASAMIFLNRRFSFKNPVDSTDCRGTIARFVPLHCQEPFG